MPTSDHRAAAHFAPEPRPRLTARGLAGMAVLYLVFAWFYAWVIAYAVRGFQPNALPDYLGRVLLLDYPLKVLWTLPVWWLLFRGPLLRVRGSRRLLAHLGLAPLWVGAWFGSYYALLSGLGLGGIGGDGRIWDVYIPTLFYGVQFGVFHVVESTQRLRWQAGREQRLREQAHHSEVAALKAQINPHFLFNTLNAISASVPPELEATRGLIARLAHTFRFALEASRQELLPLADELTFLRAYLELEQFRFGERLHTEFAVQETLLAVRVPPMLIQPLVENAVRHGLAPSVGGGTVRLLIEPHGTAAIRVVVADTGVGLRGQLPAGLLLSQAGLGLRNTHARLLALGSSGLEISTNLPQGLRVSFVLPLRHPLPAAPPVAAVLTTTTASA
ncbi:sensor histidine kinase [Hymenobacter elongatus]|uniref:Sensor histidine kinase n=1 Tax=Hymenobacter elongatus TaxID=877208 RepID=A0A4Z0PE18_9BACT|nr:histidine kinase [Hymenobacter elongatus]TGE11900.1 sensor histidine kinase [Hymenobacter elongatus]